MRYEMGRDDSSATEVDLNRLVFSSVQQGRQASGSTLLGGNRLRLEDDPLATMEAAVKGYNEDRLFKGFIEPVALGFLYYFADLRKGTRVLGLKKLEGSNCGNLSKRT